MIGAMTRAARLASARLARMETAILVAGAVAAVMTTAMWERAHASGIAVDRTLTGAAFGLALPLLAYSVVARATGGRRLDESVLELARHGVDRRHAILGLLAAANLLLAAVGGMVAGLAVVLAGGFGASGFVQDLFTSTWLGVVGATLYTWFFGLGSTWGKAGGGRLALLLLDYFLGASTSAMALPWPRGHLRNLLGAEPVLGMAQGTAFLALVLLVLGYVLATLLRSPR